MDQLRADRSAASQHLHRWCAPAVCQPCVGIVHAVCWLLWGCSESSRASCRGSFQVALTWGPGPCVGTYLASHACNTHQYTQAGHGVHTVLIGRVALGDPHYAEKAASAVCPQFSSTAHGAVAHYCGCVSHVLGARPLVLRQPSVQVQMVSCCALLHSAAEVAGNHLLRSGAYPSASGQLRAPAAALALEA